jgi:Iodothyronine deiodinase
MCSASALNQLQTEFRERVDFYVVYIQEAHPEGELLFGRGGMPGVHPPTTLDERATMADACSIAEFQLQFLLDDLQDSTADAYDAEPDRLYLIDAEGRVAYKGGHGPQGFQPDELRAAIQTALEP